MELERHEIHQAVELVQVGIPIAQTQEVQAFPVELQVVQELRVVAIQAPLHAVLVVDVAAPPPVFPAEVHVHPAAELEVPAVAGRVALPEALAEVPETPAAVDETTAITAVRYPDPINRFAV